MAWLVAAAAAVGLVVADHGGMNAVLVVLGLATGLSVAPGAMAAARRTLAGLLLA